MLIIEDTRLCPIRIYVYSSYSKKNNFIGLYNKLKRSYSKIITDEEMSCLSSEIPFLDAADYFNHHMVEHYLFESLDKEKKLCAFTISFENDW